MRPFVAAFGLTVLLAGCGSGSPAGAPSARGGRLEVDDTLAFGIVELGRRVERTLILRNVGTGPLEVESIEVAAPFGGGEGAPAIVAPGQTLAVKVSFAPAGPGPVRAIARVRAGGTEHEVSLAGTGGASPIRCRPEVVDLGRPVVMTERTFVVSCSIESNASQLDAHIEYEGPPAMTCVPSDWPSLPSGPGTVSFELAFAPAGLEPVDAPIRFVSGGATLAEIPVHARPIATAVGPIEVPACPRGLDLGFNPPGTTTTRTFALANVGDRPLRVTAAEVEGPFSLAPAAPFDVPADDPSTPEDEGRLEVTAIFAPAANGPAAGTVRFAFEDDPGTPEWAGCLTGFGGGPAIACAPTMVDFGLVASGAPRTEEIRCTNVGTDVPGTDADRLRFTSIVTRGAGFTADGSLPANGLGAGESFALDVTFTPTATAGATGALVVESNDPLLPRLEVPLVGDGVLAGPCDYRVDPASLSFGPVAAGGTPADLAVSIRNVGREACVVRDMALAATSSPAFSLRDGPLGGVLIEPGEHLDVPVRFTPASGNASGAVAFSISDADVPVFSVPLAGAAAPAQPCVRLYPESVDFGEVGPGCASLTAELMLVNTCPVPTTLHAVEWVGPAGPFRVPSATAGSTLQPGVPTSLAIEYRPTSGGEHLAGLRVRTAVEGESRLVPVRGRATTPSGVETFSALPARIDVLVVMDNSGATGLEQRATAGGLPAFLEVANGWSRDWQFGVTTTGLSNPCGNPGGAGGAEDGRLFPVDGSRARIVRPTMPDAATIAAANLIVGECHYDEQGMEAAYRALTPPVIDHADDPRHPEANDGNLGLVRTNARLAVIVEMDESDQSPGLSAYYAASMAGVKRAPWRDHRFVGHAITGDRTTGCAGAGTAAEAGDELIAWSEASGGHFMSICQSDWETAMADLGVAVFGRHRFPLKGRPAGVLAPSSSDLRVFVDGHPWAGPSTGWRWDEARNEVVFDLAYSPEPTSAVEIRYTPRCVAPAD